VYLGYVETGCNCLTLSNKSVHYQKKGTELSGGGYSPPLCVNGLHHREKQWSTHPINECNRASDE
jgi:hypothetical protein